MRLRTLALACLSIVGVRARNFNITDFIVPPLVHAGQSSVEISCHYDGNFTKLQIFRGTDEMFRFEPRVWPALRSHPVPGVGSISTNNCGSSACHLQLANLTERASGIYSCELEHDTPPYLYTKRTATMKVQATPRRMPYIDGLGKEFGEGDEMQAVCRIEPGSMVKWFVNERIVLPLYGLRTFKYKSTRSLFVGDPPSVKVQCIEERGFTTLGSKIMVARWVDRAHTNTTTEDGHSDNTPQTMKISENKEVTLCTDCTNNSANVAHKNIFQLLSFTLFIKIVFISC